MLSHFRPTQGYSICCCVRGSDALRSLNGLRVPWNQMKMMRKMMRGLGLWKGNRGTCWADLGDFRRHIHGLVQYCWQKFGPSMYRSTVKTETKQRKKNIHEKPTSCKGFFKLRDVLCQLRLATLSLSNLVLRSARVLIWVSVLGQKFKFGSGDPRLHDWPSLPHVRTVDPYFNTQMQNITVSN